MRESTFGDAVVHALRGAGAFVHKMHGSAFGQAGMPDLFVAHMDWIGWVELKVGSNKLTPLQAARMRQIESAGCPVVVLRRRTARGHVEIESWSGGQLGAVESPRHLIESLKRIEVCST